MTRNHLYTHGVSLETYIAENPSAGVKGKLSPRSEETKQKMRDSHAARTDAEKHTIMEKTKEAHIVRYGVSHSSKSEEVKLKIKSTNNIRFGGHPAKTDAVKEKTKETWFQKYGAASPQNDPTVVAKRHTTNIERYGEPTTMAIARRAFLDTNDGKNPFQLDHIKAKIKERNQAEFGADHNKQAHISKENLDILGDKDRLQLMIDEFPIRMVADRLGVDPTTVARRCADMAIVRPSSSSVENAVATLLRSQGIVFLERSRKIISPLELDFVIPERKIAIEVCGVYWHSDLFLSSGYHLDKVARCEKAGYRLITIFEDEIVLQWSIVRARILYFLGIGVRGVGARSTTIMPLGKAEADLFLGKHHIQGASRNSSIRLGAKSSDGELIAVMTFKKSWRVNGAIELDRFSTDGRNHSGIASRLFRWFVTKHNPMWVISYADRRWSQGALYEQLGFTKTVISQPSYSYVRNTLIRHDKSKFRKTKIAHLVENGSEKTESEIMKELGYYRVYDCGTIRYDWKNNEQY